MFQGRFINHNKRTTVVEYVNNEGGYAYVGAKCIRGISLPSAQFSCEPITALKSEVFKKNNSKIEECFDTATPSDMLVEFSWSASLC